MNATDKYAIAKKHAAEYETAKRRYNSDRLVINRSTPDPDLRSYFVIAITEGLLKLESEMMDAQSQIGKLKAIADRAEQLAVCITAIKGSNHATRARHPLPEQWNGIIHECEMLCKALENFKSGGIPPFKGF